MNLDRILICDGKRLVLGRRPLLDKVRQLVREREHDGLGIGCRLLQIEMDAVILGIEIAVGIPTVDVRRVSRIVKYDINAKSLGEIVREHRRPFL